MLTIELPELQLYNTEFFKQLFDRLWPTFMVKHLGEGLHNKNIEDVFYLDSVSITMETFTRSIEEMVQAVNARRPFDLSYVVFDYNDYMDTYSFEDTGVANVDSDHYEGLMFDFFHYLIETMISPEFLSYIAAHLTAPWENLNAIVGRYNVVGIWYEPYIGAYNMWESGDKVYGIQEGDYRVVHTAPWDGQHSNSVFYPYLSNADDEFYWVSSYLIKASYANAIIPRGEIVSLCILNADVVQAMGL